MNYLAYGLGVLTGISLTGFIFTTWLKQDPRRLGAVVRWILEYLQETHRNGFLKIYVSIFETNKASKVLAYARPEDIAEAVKRFAIPPTTFPLQTHPGMGENKNGNRESDQDTGRKA